jgi:hypothetical protein
MGNCEQIFQMATMNFFELDILGYLQSVKQIGQRKMLL